MLEQIAKTERNLPPQIWSPQILNTILSVQLFTSYKFIKMYMHASMSQTSLKSAEYIKKNKYLWQYVEQQLTWSYITFKVHIQF